MKIIALVSLSICVHNWDFDTECSFHSTTASSHFLLKCSLFSLRWLNFFIYLFLSKPVVHFVNVCSILYGKCAFISLKLGEFGQILPKIIKKLYVLLLRGHLLYLSFLSLLDFSLILLKVFFELINTKQRIINCVCLRIPVVV